MGGGHTSKLSQIAQRVALGTLLLVALMVPSRADDDTLLPSGFFDTTPAMGSENISIQSDQLTYDADRHLVLADGNVQIDYQGATFQGDHLVFDQRAHTAHFVGNVVVHSADGQVYTATDLELGADARQALMRQLTITTKDGALVTAADGSFRRGDDTVLNEATYSPCGQCIDSKGRRIGWSAKAVRMVYHGKTEMVDLDQPSLYLLGIPVAWLPWLSLPNPTKRISSFRMPSVDYSDKFGARLNLPYFVAVSNDDDLILTPSLMSRQGLLMAGEWDHRFPNGTIQVKAAGLRQMDPSAYAGSVGDVDWRGAVQTSGHFVPVATWQAGWSYTAFTDAQFLTDYHYREYTNTAVTNEVYATHLDRNEFIDVRLQQFNLLGTYATTAAQQAAQDKQARALPARYRNVLYLPRQMGEIDLSADLLGVQRAGDDTRATLNGVPYNFGYAETKVHGTVEADWQKRYIVPGGVAVTPLVGLRADAAYADYTDTSSGSPGVQKTISLFNATPIAAVDVRYPLVASAGWATQVFEPIGQLVYRGSDVTNVGITNDNAQSFIFDDTNLFSYNRFSGTDRQETGLRANVGAHYQVDFDNGSWVDLIGGQSFQLAGTNAFAQNDPTQVTTGQGMSSSSSYVVLGAKGSPARGLTFYSKLQVDPNAPRVTRSGVGGTYDIAGYDFALDYMYVAQDTARGVLADQQTVSAGVSVPFMDYWRLKTHASWDIAANSWLDAGGGLYYDDGYLRYGGEVEATGPTNTNANDLRVTGSIYLKGLGGVGN